MDPKTRQTNTDALANSILIAVALPWLLCFAWFACLHRTYPQARAAAIARKRAAHDAEKAFAPTRPLPSAHHGSLWKESLIIRTPRESLDSKDGGETRPRLSAASREEPSWAQVGPGDHGAVFIVGQGEDGEDSDELHL